MRILFFSMFLLMSVGSTIRCMNEEIDLKIYEKRLISQNGEDGVLQKIFSTIGVTSQYYVDFGAGDGHFGSNTKYLREKYGWTGLLMDGGCANKMEDNVSLNLHQEFITAENICDLFRKYDVPCEFDLLSIDIDRNDFYVWQALGALYSPRVVVIEFNHFFNWDEDKVIKYSANAVWDGTGSTGASILAMYNLGRSLGYSLVYQEANAANLFFIRDDVLVESGAHFKNVNNVFKIYTGTPNASEIGYHRNKFISSSKMLNSKL